MGAVVFIIGFFTLAIVAVTVLGVLQRARGERGTATEVLPAVELPLGEAAGSLERGASDGEASSLAVDSVQTSGSPQPTGDDRGPYRSYEGPADPEPWEVEADALARRFGGSVLDGMVLEDDPEVHAQLVRAIEGALEVRGAIRSDEFESSFWKARYRGVDVVVALRDAEVRVIDPARTKRTLSLWHVPVDDGFSRLEDDLWIVTGQQPVYRGLPPAARTALTAAMRRLDLGRVSIDDGKIEAAFATMIDGEYGQRSLRLLDDPVRDLAEMIKRLAAVAEALRSPREDAS